MKNRLKKAKWLRLHARTDMVAQKNRMAFGRPKRTDGGGRTKNEGADKPKLICQLRDIANSAHRKPRSRRVCLPLHIDRRYMQRAGRELQGGIFKLPGCSSRYVRRPLGRGRWLAIGGASGALQSARHASFTRPSDNQRKSDPQSPPNVPQKFNLMQPLREGVTLQLT